MSSGSPSFAELRRAADQVDGSQLLSPPDTQSLSDHIPKRFTWKDLASELARPEDLDTPGRIAAIRACLDAEPSRLEPPTENQTDEDAIARRQVRRFVARAVSPLVGGGDDGLEYDDELTHGDDLHERREIAVRRCQTLADDGLAVLERVGLPSVSGDAIGTTLEGDDAQVLYTITALADAGQPWTNDVAASRAKRLLTDTFGSPEGGHAQAKSQWITDGILKQYLRPLFARSRPATVTETGRKAAFGGGNGASTRGDIANVESPKAKPWKYVDLRAISVFAWAVHEADGALIRGNWPLFIPVLLALVDDSDTTVRARGLVLLRTFVDSVPEQGGESSLLHATGLDSVLSDAVFPTLLFLPRLTPEKESLQLLGPAYQALLSLASAAAPSNATLPSKPAADLLDRILRDGIYTGYFHANEHIRIVEELVHQAGHVVQAMGVHAVKHLKDLMPLYAGIMTDPFAMRYTPAVTATLDALQTTIVACWPRMANTAWEEETLKMLMLCWLNVQEGLTEGSDAMKAKADLQTRLVLAADTLLAIMVAAKVDLDAKVVPLISKEPRLKALFRLT